MTPIDKWLKWAERLEAAATAGPWESSDAIESRKFAAQVWDPNGDSLAGLDNLVTGTADANLIVATRNYNAAVLDVVRVAAEIAERWELRHDELRCDLFNSTKQQPVSCTCGQWDMTAKIEQAIARLAATAPEDVT